MSSLAGRRQFESDLDLVGRECGQDVVTPTRAPRCETTVSDLAIAELLINSARQASRDLPLSLTDRITPATTS